MRKFITFAILSMVLVSVSSVASAQFSGLGLFGTMNASGRSNPFFIEANFGSTAHSEVWNMTLTCDTETGFVIWWYDVSALSTANSVAAWDAGTPYFVTANLTATGSTTNLTWTTPSYSGVRRFVYYLMTADVYGISAPVFSMNVSFSVNNGTNTATAVADGGAAWDEYQGTTTGGASGSASFDGLWWPNTIRSWTSLGAATDKVAFDFTVDHGGTARVLNIGIDATYNTAGTGGGTTDVRLYDMSGDGGQTPVLTVNPSGTAASPVEAVNAWASPSRSGSHKYRVVVTGGTGYTPSPETYVQVAWDGTPTFSASSAPTNYASPVSISPAGGALTTSPTALTASGGTPTVSYVWSIQGTVPAGVSLSTTTGATTDLIFGATTPAGSTVTVRCANGTTGEFDEETYTLNFGGGGGGNTVSVAATSTPAAEPSTNGAWTITFSTATTASTDVSFTLTGAATFATDYSISASVGTASGTGITGIPAGTSSVVVTLTVIDDGAVEGNEDAILTLTSATQGYTVGSPSAGTVVINDDDASAANPAVSVSSTGSPSETGPTPGTFTLTASPAPAAPIQVNVAFSGTAVNGTDYTVTGVTGGLVTIPVSGSVTVTITPIDDTAVEGAESVILTISGGTGYTVGTQSAATLTIADNDSAPPPITGGGGGGGGGGCAATDGSSYWMFALGLLAMLGFGLRMRARRE
jgi:hypothetical protein